MNIGEEIWPFLYEILPWFIWRGIIIVYFISSILLFPKLLNYSSKYNYFLLLSNNIKIKTLLHTTLTELFSQRSYVPPPYLLSSAVEVIYNTLDSSPGYDMLFSVSLFFLPLDFIFFPSWRNLFICYLSVNKT